jgi:hypothetical protein
VRRDAQRAPNRLASPTDAHQLHSRYPCGPLPFCQASGPFLWLMPRSALSSGRIAGRLLIPAGSSDYDGEDRRAGLWTGTCSSG